MRPLDPLRSVADAADIAKAGTFGALRSGLARPRNPLVAGRMLSALRKWGTTPGLGFALGAVRDPEAIAIVDVDDPLQEEITFAEAEYRTTVLANSLLDRGAQPGTRVGILGRNSRAYAESIVAVSRTGADLIYLNTGSTADQVRTVCAAHDITMMIRDREFAEMIPQNVLSLGLDDPAGIPLLDSMPWSGSVGEVRQPAKHVILTSGTTSNHLRGASRTTAPLDSVAALLHAFPTRLGSVTLVAAPMFHAWGWMHHRMATVMDNTQILLRHPDPERLLALIAAYEVETLITVPVTLKKLVDLPTATKRRYDFSSLRCVAVSGSALPGDLATKFMNDYGDVLYNLYGTTEAAYATIATPEDLREDPHTAGRPMPGVRVEVFDRKGRTVPRGADGRVYVRSRTSIAEYVSDGSRGTVKGMVPTGDLGSIDDQGRLTIKGRADDMVVTGGENVYPTEVEDVLRTHADLADVAVTGRPDPVYGSVLVAHIVTNEGSDVTDEELLLWARERLGPHHRPREVHRVVELPRNDTGKVLRRVLAGEVRLEDLDEEELL
ncbi:MAG: AMP-binding protein [Candidatus Nanopelagicales bacterium]|nr:AMP-binding protein [Candidatus Nanopelagicales bacterium]MCU0297433.1 AMP-binding protein [Candidatus Nanopelagicales bacterium]